MKSEMNREKNYPKLLRRLLVIFVIITVASAFYLMVADQNLDVTPENDISQKHNVDQAFHAEKNVKFLG